MVTSFGKDVGQKPSDAASFTAVKDSSKQKFISLLLLLLLVAGPTYTLLSYSKNKFVRSEISYAEQSREMILRNDYISPSYHYLPNLDKPAMIFWTVIPAFKTLGETPFASRIQSILSALATLTLLAFALRSTFGWKSALLGTIVLATASRFIEFTSLCMVDMLLTFFDLGMLVALYASTVDEKRRGMWFNIAGVFSGLAVLTKGPVGLVLPGACFGLYLILTRQLKMLVDKRLWLAFACFLAVASPWYIAVAATMKGPEVVLEWLWLHNVERFLGQTYAYTHPPTYMVESFFLGFAPWSLLIPLVAVSSYKKWRSRENLVESRCELFMWIWVVMTIAFFTVSKGKMNYYDLPCFTAAAGLVGVHLSRWIENKSKIATVFAWVLGAALVVAGGFACYILPHITGNAVQSWILAPLAVFIPAAIIFFSLIRGNTYRAYAFSGLAILLALFAFSAQALPAIGRQIPAIPYLYRIRYDSHDYKIAMHSDFAITVDWVDHGVFITGHIPDLVTNQKETISFLQQKERAYLLIPADRFAELPADLRDRCKVLDSRPYISDKLGLQFILKRHGDLCGSVPLLLVANDRSIK
jgi:4-amino-4-deoxy-L-arabinose transferase-like glycosyltransferase